jgi:tetratricopeptide (TPR) repeat protein
MCKPFIMRSSVIFLCFFVMVSSFRTSKRAVDSSISNSRLHSFRFNSDSKVSIRHESFIQAAVASVFLSVLIAMPNGAFAKPGDIAPTDRDNQLVQMAFRDFDLKRFKEADKEFSLSITRWLELDRPRDEIVALLKARSSVRLDGKNFQGSLEDCDEAIRLMSTDGEKPDGTAAYPEYPDSFVSRGLANEGLADWKAALVDYNKAVALWGGGRGDDVNPYTLTFRGNTLGRLNRYEEAIEDYEAASNTFNSMRDVARYSDARANMALALYQVGRTDESVKAMNDVIRKNPGYADMHVAIAADAWSKGDYILALKVI